jgi:hypothetical protein
LRRGFSGKTGFEIAVRAVGNGFGGFTDGFAL